MAEDMVQRDEERDPLTLDIDLDNLDLENSKHSRRFTKQARRLAHAKLAVNEAKAQMKVVEADLFFKIKQNWESYGLKKEPSDKTTEMVVLLQPEYKKAVEKYNNSVHHMHMLEAAVDGYEHRKSNIESLVYLHGQGYFATPRTKGDYARRVDPEEVRRPLRDRGSDD